MYRAFNQVKTQVTRNLQYLLSQQLPSKALSAGTQLAGALTLGLTYINRLQVNSPLRPPSARILVVSTSVDAKGQYIPIMNAIFAAQKSRIAIDVARIADEGDEAKGSTFLQQAAYTTGGVYTPLSTSAVETSLPQYLLQLYASDLATRSHLVFPKRYARYMCCLY
jgi:transcription initiation factor TFIIH subunit 3